MRKSCRQQNSEVCLFTFFAPYSSYTFAEYIEWTYNWLKKAPHSHDLLIGPPTVPDQPHIVVPPLDLAPVSPRVPRIWCEVVDVVKPFQLGHGDSQCSFQLPTINSSGFSTDLKYCKCIVLCWRETHMSTLAQHRLMGHRCSLRRPTLWPSDILIELSDWQQPVVTKTAVLPSSATEPLNISMFVKAAQDKEKRVDLDIKRNSMRCSCFLCDNFWFSVKLVLMLPMQDVFSYIVTNNRISLQATESLIQSHIEPDNPMTVSLTCPLSGQRIRKPACIRFCRHLQCFDLSAFLMQPANPMEMHRLECPVCHFPAAHLDVAYIEWFDQRILKRFSQVPADSRFHIYQDGRIELVGGQGEVSAEEHGAEKPAEGKQPRVSEAAKNVEEVSIDDEPEPTAPVASVEPMEAPPQHLVRRREEGSPQLDGSSVCSSHEDIDEEQKFVAQLDTIPEHVADAMEVEESKRDDDDEMFGTPSVLPAVKPQPQPLSDISISTEEEEEEQEDDDDVEDMDISEADDEMYGEPVMLKLDNQQPTTASDQPSSASTDDNQMELFGVPTILPVSAKTPSTSVSPPLIRSFFNTPPTAKVATKVSSRPSFLFGDDDDDDDDDDSI